LLILAAGNGSPLALNAFIASCVGTLPLPADCFVAGRGPGARTGDASEGGTVPLADATHLCRSFVSCAQAVNRRVQECEASSSAFAVAPP
jgi:hypothetical protein